MVVSDSGAILDFLEKDEPVRPGGIGSIGYCMGGRHVMCVAGAVPVAPHFSPSPATVSTTSLPSATAVVELEASVFEPAQKPRHWQEIGPPQ
jgi:dienelactone hydrolase